MKKFIKTPAANAFLGKHLKGMSSREMRRGHLGQTGQRRV